MKTSEWMKKLPAYLFAELDRKRQRAVRAGADIIALSIGDPDIPTPAPVVEAGLKALACAENHCYPSNKTGKRLRQAIAKWHYRRHGVRFNPDSEILVLIGSKEGIAHTPLALVDPGENVLVPDPGYPPYKAGALLAGADIVPMPLKISNNFLPDFRAIGQKMLNRAGLMFLNYPNNPTGACAGMDFYREAVKFAKKHSIWIAQDAAYSEIYSADPPRSIFELPRAKDVALEFYSLSKTFSMAGWRIGWVCGNAKAVGALARLKENIDSGVFSAVQEAGTYALEHAEEFGREIRGVYAKRKKFFKTGLEKLGWEVFDSEATFYLWVKTPKGLSSAECAGEIFEKARVLVSPGSGFGSCGEGYIRISVTASDNTLQKALGRISNLAFSAKPARTQK